MPSYPDDVNPGQFIGTTQVYDLSQSNVQAEDFTARLRNNFNSIVLSLNTKDSGYYAQEEFVCGQLFTPDYSRVDSASTAPATYRQVYRKVINTGTLPNTAAKTVAHGINVTADFTFTRIYGCATRPDIQVAIPLPFQALAALNQTIQVYVDPTNVFIVTGIDRTQFTRSYIILEYTKF